MNEQANGQLKTPAQGQGKGSGNQPDGHGEAPRLTVDKAADGKTTGTAAGAPDGRTSEAVLGPFTVRDLTVFGSTLILFVASLIPMFAVRYNLWNLGSLFFLGLGILLPVIVTALFAARRLSPGTRIRIGSLSVDQFGSVVASFAVAFFFLSVAGAYVPSMLLALVGALGLFSATVLARLIPFFAGDFQGRAEVPAHVVARESAVPVRKPRAPKAPKEAREEHAPKTAGTNPVAGWAKRMVPGGKSDAAVPAGATGAAHPATTPAAAEAPARTAAPTPAAPSAAGPAAAATGTAAAATGADAAAEQTRAGEVPASSGHAPTTVNPQVRGQEPIGATVDPASRPEEHDDVRPVHEAFWFAVAQPRTAVDEHSGAPAFVIEPGGWVLALEDRGHEFLVQHTDGRVGLLRDLSNIERG